MSTSTLEVCDTEAELVQHALAHARAMHDRALAERGRFVLALAGGSTPRPIHRALAEVDWLQWPRTHVFFGDERAVPAAHPASNYGMARRDLLDAVCRNRGLPEDQLHPLDGGAADWNASVAACERSLAASCEGRLDLLFVGLGADAHILSLHPGAKPLEHPGAEGLPWFVVLADPPMDPPFTRLTATPAVVHNARQVVALATSEKKAEALRLALEGDDDPSHIPAHILRRAPSVVWLADRLSARRLQPR